MHSCVVILYIYLECIFVGFVICCREYLFYLCRYSGASDDVKTQLNEMATQVKSNVNHGILRVCIS